MKIRTVLLGAVGAGALVGGLLAGAGPASAAPSAKGCLGAGCDGGWPVPSGCSAGAYTVFQVSRYDFTSRTTVTVQLRYSPGCRSVWAKIYGSGAPNGDLFWVHNRGTGRSEFANFDTQGQNSQMVGDLGTRSQACVNVSTANPARHITACTSFA
jgi:hypothetical protein